MASVPVSAANSAPKGVSEAGGHPMTDDDRIHVK